MIQVAYDQALAEWEEIKGNDEFVKEKVEEYLERFNLAESKNEQPARQVRRIDEDEEHDDEADENDNGAVEYMEFVPVAVDLVMVMLAKESFASTKRTRRSSAKAEAKDFLLKGLPKGELENSIREVR